MNSFSGPVIEFLEYPPHLVSVGHDGFFPKILPLDEIYIKAEKGEKPSAIELHSVEIHLHHTKKINISNYLNSSPRVRVHRAGYLWHDRTRDITNQFLDALLNPLCGKWLSIFGITVDDPRKTLNLQAPLLTSLPRMHNQFNELLPSQDWKTTKDFHTRNREWMKTTKQTAYYDAISRRYERDTALVAKIKSTRGYACQICGYKFTKHDGTGYCEVHHLEALADGGLDVSANMLVLCANCHKVFHYGTVEVISHTSIKIDLLIDGILYSCQTN